MTSATCPSCGKALKPGAVICVQCGFDLRTGQKLTTEVISGTVGRTRPEGQQKFACEKYHICQLQGLSTKILVCDDNEEVVAYIHGRAHPLWTCFSVVVAVPLFFLVPVESSALWPSQPVPQKKSSVLNAAIVASLSTFA